MSTASDLSRLRALSTKHFRQWLANLAESREALGSELVETAPGFPTRSPVDFDDMLRLCESLGWITRSFFAPSISAQAFNGLQYGALSRASDEAKQIHASWYAWRVVDAEAIKSFCGQTTTTKTNYAIGDRVKYAPLFVAQVQGGAAMRKARGVVVGLTDDGRPRVSWSDDPKDEPACQALVDDPPKCITNTNGVRSKACACPRVPYGARAVHPKAIRHE